MQTGRGGHDAHIIKSWNGYPSKTQLRGYVSDLVADTIYGGEKYEDSWACSVYVERGKIDIGTGVDPARAALVNPCSEIPLTASRNMFKYIEDDRNWDA